jgi:hypothetical protein
MKRSLYIGLGFYLAGLAVTVALLLWHGIQNGGLQRSHSFTDLIFLALAYTAYGALWPVLLILLALHVFG